MATKRMEKIASVVENADKDAVIKKTYNPEDLIPCRSIVSGQLFIKGDRSGYMYNWADYGDVVDVEYRDLNYMARTSGNVAIYSPRIIVEDEDFIGMFPKIQAVYDSMFSANDLREILKLNANEMKATIESLPDGAKESLKGLAATLIEEGRLDSVTKIKAIDEIFGTQLLLTLTQG